ncbi:MAG TPA: hypothetical protein VHV75_18135 [Solirubrobacteraceae bacterium]|nr:hypothetical protein [Solirubrobacteraceae bacterium]
MDAAPLVRLRWRLRGAWLWPSFVVLTLADGAILHDLPLAGDSASLIGAWLLGVVLSLLAIVLLAGPLGHLVRRLRPDMPKLVARNYAGALLTLAITLALVAGGLVHRHVINADRGALEDAVARAEAYIGDHAPAEFQYDLTHLNTYPAQPPDIYRTCAINPSGTRSYCVVVNRQQPFGRSVHYDGAEPNGILAEGTN